MFGLFGTKKKEEPKRQINLQETTNRISNNIGDLKLRLDQTNSELKQVLENFRNAKNPTVKQQMKNKATNLLKKKKMYESHIQNLENTQYNVESANIQTQMIRDTNDIIRVMKDTVDTQKAMMKEVNIESVHDLMDEMHYIKEDQEEINDTLARTYDVEVDDEELDAELDELDHQLRVDLDANSLCAPNKRVLSKKEEDEKALEDILRD